MAMPPPLLRLHPHRLLPRLRRFTSGPVLLRLHPKSLYATASTSQAAPTPPPQPPPHGPSLRRGRPTTGHPPEAPLSFSRTFDLAALRVPAAACASLERRLRGHLLNWPRVRNIARLPNDDGDGLVSLPTSPGSSSALPPTAVARREKLAREFNARGFVEFPILAKMSRPAGRTRRETKGKAAGGKETKHEKDKVYVVEVLEQGGEDDEDEWKGLVGEEGFGKGAWRGEPTRLLLLDEVHANRRVDELPEAVKVVLEHEANQGGPFAYELVQCQLTLFYDYWPMNEVLEALLPEGIIIPAGFETVGHIAHLNLRDEHLPYKTLIAQVVLDKNKPKIQTVVNKIDAIQNDYRTMQLEILAGHDSLVTTVIESGLRFQVDLATVYWNSRLSTERQRLVNNIFQNSDVVSQHLPGCRPPPANQPMVLLKVYEKEINGLVKTWEGRTKLNSENQTSQGRGARRAGRSKMG
ncbi:hypothetical protein ACQJBY_026474 [Aegilops geniculata]